MRVEFLQHVSSPYHGTVKPGDIREVAETEANRLIREGFAKAARQFSAPAHDGTPGHKPY